MKVSVVIPNFNGEAYLDNCLNSLYKQEYREFEILVVDNGSKDRSLEVLEEHSSNIKIIELKENLGFSRACNEGSKAASGELVVLLNNDTLATPEWLGSLVSCIERDNKIFSCCSKMLRFNEKELIDDAGDEYNIFGWSYKRGDGNPKATHELKDRSVFSSCAGAAIYRKSILLELGGFDESFFAYLEDIDLSYRALIHGYKNIYCSKAEVYHVGSATSGSRYNQFKARLTAKNNFLVIYKNMPLLQLIFNLPFIALGFLIKYLFYDKKGLGKAYKEGIVLGFKGIKTSKKVAFRLKNIKNYLKIQLLLIKNVFVMVKG
ncbi:glycosyltransferase family 2 protein [Alloiococcus sp. CFN-8]|uniref:glycosyltransferase family 2 protein n=1 Tax=Alloiococcus sp. CFN-8 TaxID=3416081 RepID=UPI003CED8F2B